MQWVPMNETKTMSNAVSQLYADVMWKKKISKLNTFFQICLEEMDVVDPKTDWNIC